MESEPGADVPQICSIVAAPALAMALGSAAVSVGEPSERLQARLQHFSAGVLIGAIVTEIFPILRQRLTSPVAALAAAVGFAGALLLMYSVKSMDLAGGEAPAPAEAAHGPEERATREQSAKLKISLSRLQAHSKALCRLTECEDVDREAVDEEVHGIDFLVDSARRLCRGCERLDAREAAQLRSTVSKLVADIEALRALEATHELEQQLLAAGRTLRRVHFHAEHGGFRRWAPRAQEQELEQPRERAMPWGLVIAVAVDSVIDGMLIGLAGAVAASSGWMMAMATSIEMCFLGYSFACVLVKAARPFATVALLALPPLAMLAAAAAATAGAAWVEPLPAFCGFVAFALVAVLFLVVQELLVEAHEKEDGEAWHIGVWLYIGLLMSICFDVVL